MGNVFSSPKKEETDWEHRGGFNSWEGKGFFSVTGGTTIHIMGGIMMKIIGAGILFLLLVLFSLSNSAVIYKWVDKSGSVNFTDDISKVPPEYRDQIQIEETGDVEKTQTPSPAPASAGKTEAVKRDALGMSEDYWRDRVQPWKKQLKQAQEDYNNTNIKIDDAIEVFKNRYYSHTQYNLKRVEVERLTAERGTYEAKMNEANEMLAKIAKEAEEAKADPAWLK